MRWLENSVRILKSLGLAHVRISPYVNCLNKHMFALKICEIFLHFIHCFEPMTQTFISSFSFRSSVRLRARRYIFELRHLQDSY